MTVEILIAVCVASSVFGFGVVFGIGVGLKHAVSGLFDGLSLLGPYLEASQRRDHQLYLVLKNLGPYIDLLVTQAEKVKEAVKEGASTQDTVVLIKQQLREAHEAGVLPDYLYDRYMMELEGKPNV